MRIKTIISSAILFLVLGIPGCDTSSDSTNSTTTPVNCLSFDGVDDYVVLMDSPSLDLNSNFTISLWYYHSNNSSIESGLIQKDGPGSWGRYGLWIIQNRVDYCIFIDGSGQSCLQSSESLVLDNWHHIAGVFDGSEMIIYINGVEAGQQDLSGSVSVSDLHLFIGSDPSDGLSTECKIRDIRIWSIAQSQSQIQSSMTTTLIGDEDDLVCYLPVEEGIGQTVLDLSIHQNHGQLGSTPAVDDNDPTWFEVLID